VKTGYNEQQRTPFLGLWESAETTHCDLLGRLAVVHMVHEARGLDVQPRQIEKFRKNGDKESLEILEIVYQEEIGHVAAGLKWFTYICENSQPQKVRTCVCKLEDAFSLLLTPATVQSD